MSEQKYYVDRNGNYFTEAFTLNECGWFNNSIYRSKIDNNLTNPELDSENWEVI